MQVLSWECRSRPELRLLFLPLSFTACDAQSHSHAFLCPSTRETCSFQGVPFGDEAEKGRRMTTTFDLGCQRMLYRFPRDGRSSASFLSAPDLTDRGLAAFHKRRCSGLRDALKQESVLALYWQLTGAGHGMSFVAALDSAQQAWRYVELF